MVHLLDISRRGYLRLFTILGRVVIVIVNVLVELLPAVNPDVGLIAALSQQ